MKRKFLSLLLSLAMCLSLLPTAALADEPAGASTYEPVKLENYTFSDNPPTDITTTGLNLNFSASPAPAVNVWYKADSGAVYLVRQDTTTYTLVLDNATVNCGSNYAINLTLPSGGKLNIELKGTNALEGGLKVTSDAIGSDKISVQIVSGEDVPTLKVKRNSGGNALYVEYGSLKIEGVKATAENSTGNVIAASGDLTITNATVTAIGSGGHAISSASNSITITKSSVNATADGDVGNNAIKANTSVTINDGSTVTAMAICGANYEGDGGNAIYAGGTPTADEPNKGSVTISGGSTVTATATGSANYEGKGANAIYAENNSITINGSTVNATSESNNAINAANAVTIENRAAVTATSTNLDAINADGTPTADEPNKGSVTIKGGSKVNATSENSTAINSTNNSVTISGSTVNATSENNNAINAANAVTIENSAAVTATSTHGNAINAKNAVTISGSSNVTATTGEYGKALGVGDGKDVTVGTAENPGGTLNLSGGTSTVSGAFTVNDGATVNIAPGTTLKIDNSDPDNNKNGSLTVEGTGDTKGKVVNNGVMEFSASATLPTNITGAGYVNNGGSYSTNSGTALSNSGDLNLSSLSSPSSGTGYDWDGSTLTLTNARAGSITLPSSGNVKIKINGYVVTGNISNSSYTNNSVSLTIDGVTSSTSTLYASYLTTTFATAPIAVKNLTAYFDGISSAGTNQQLTLEGATVTTKSVSWPDFNDTPTGGNNEGSENCVSLSNSTLTVNGTGKYNDFTAVSISLDNGSKIILRNAGATSGKPTLTMDSYKNYLPDGYLPGLYNYNTDQYVYAIMQDTGTPRTVRASSVHAAPASAAEPLVVYASAVHAADAPTLTLATSLTLEPYYTLTLDPNGGVFTSAPSGFTQNPGGNTVSTRRVGGSTLAFPSDEPDRGDGYRFDGWLNSDGSPFTPPSSFTFNDNLTLTAKWTQLFTITASTDGNGSITPSSATVAVGGDSPLFTITADTDYHIADVLVDGVSVGAVSSYSFTNVRANHTIRATFAADSGGTPITYTITASAGTGGSISPNDDVSVAAGDSQTFTITAADGNKISSVKVDSGANLINSAENLTTYTYTFTGVSAGHTIHATFAADSGGATTPSGSSATAYYTLTASAGANGSITPSGASRVSRGSGKTYTITPAAGYSVSRVLVDGEDVGAVTSYSFTNVRANHSITAYFTITGLNGRDHTAYLKGYPDGNFGPEANLTRAETATILYRLLTAERRAEIETSECSFTDVSADAWYRTAVATMANGGYINGLPDGSFGGDRDISRAEFVTILARFLGMQSAQGRFTDVTQEHWSYDAVATAANAGWVNGDGGLFRPDDLITRAEAVAIINRVLNRGVDASSNLLGFRNPPDNSADKWYYYELIEAANGHDYTGERPSENWTALHN